MKKNPKKLVLHRETLLELNRRDIRSAVGGATATCNTCPADCQYSYHPILATCNTCRQTCTTNLC